MSKLKSTVFGKGLRLLVIGLSAVGVSTTAIAQDAACHARCQAQENKCRLESKGDSAKCNAIATQCLAGCRKQQ